MRKWALVFVALGLGLVVYLFIDGEVVRQDSAISDSGEELSGLESNLAPDDLGTAPDLIDASSVAADDDAHTATSEIFRSITPELRARYEIVVRDKFFRNGDPHLYRQHDIVEIDTEALQQELEGSSNLYGDSPHPVTIPLLSGIEVEILIDGWKDTGLGVVAAFGRVVGADDFTSDVSFYFGDDGRLEASIVIGDHGYIITDVGDHAYYMVMELDTPQIID